MTNTTHLGMPFIEGSQSQKHVTHNEALRILDAVIQIGVLDRDRTLPPVSPAEGDRHIVASGATGAWAGQADAVATYEDGAWRFLTPKPGWCAWSDADGALLVYDGAAWTDVASGGGGGSGSLALLGINDTASDPNLLTVKSNAALFNAIDVADGGTGDMRLQISRESGGNAASVVFSDAFSGRAEFGLVGSDAFKLKVSNDGSTFVEALVVDQSSGNATLPRGLSLTGVVSPPQITSNQNDYNPAGIASASLLNLSSDAPRSVSGLASGAEGRVVGILNTGSQPVTLLNENASSTAANRFALGGDIVIKSKRAALLRYDGAAARWFAIARPAPGMREVLTANRTYYVRTDGSDSNDGLSNTSGGALALPQKALDLIFGTLDLGGFNVDIQLGAGTYTGNFVANSPQVGAGTITIKGDTTVANTANYVLNCVSGTALTVSGFGTKLTIEGFEVRGNGGISATNGGYLSFSGYMRFGPCTSDHARANNGAIDTMQQPIGIAGGATSCLRASPNGYLNAFNSVITILTGTWNFSMAFALADRGSVLSCSGTTFTLTGTVTGIRYDVSTNAVIFTGGGGPNFFPGNSAGVSATGGQYA
jgi:hypothetical protein